MKVLLISNYRPDKQHSMLRYAQMLQYELNKRGLAVHVVHPPIVLGGFLFFPDLLKKWLGYIDKYLFAPAYLRKQAVQADIIHVCDHSNAMYLRCAGTKRALVTCHDLLAIFGARGAYPGVKVGFTGRIQQRWIATNLSRAQHVICVSAKTQDDLESLAPGIRANTAVIHHHLNWNYAPALPQAIIEEKRKSHLEPEAEYLLHVGGNYWYKNRLGAMKIFFALRKYPRFQDVKLITAGKSWTSEMRRYCQSTGLINEIIERVDVSNEELQALYSGAIALLFPSLEEGFGWPVLEAQACGCPVITSNRPPMTEIAGEGALFIDPSTPERAAQTIAEHAPDLPSLRPAGFRNLTRFAKSQMIERYLEFYQQVAGTEERMATSSGLG
jgi:glycosyltransferase involved in cell wall biosynthesis